MRSSLVRARSSRRRLLRGSSLASARIASKAERRAGRAPRRASSTCESRLVRKRNSRTAPPAVLRSRRNREGMAARVGRPPASEAAGEQCHTGSVGDRAVPLVRVEVIAARPVSNHRRLAATVGRGHLVVVPAGQIGGRRPAAVVKLGQPVGRVVARGRGEGRSQVAIEQLAARGDEQLVEGAEEARVSAREEVPVKATSRTGRPTPPRARPTISGTRRGRLRVRSNSRFRSSSSNRSRRKYTRRQSRLRGYCSRRPSMRASSAGRGRRSSRSAAGTTPSRAESHSACEGAYLVWVDRRSTSAAPASKSRLTRAFSSGWGSRSRISTRSPVSRSKSGMRA